MPTKSLFSIAVLPDEGIEGRVDQLESVHLVWVEEAQSEYLYFQRGLSEMDKFRYELIVASK